MTLQNKSRNMMLVASLTIFAKFIAIIRQIILTYFYGASTISDAYILAQTIPNTLFLLVSSAIGVSFMPVFNQVRNDKGNQEAELFTRRMINFVLVLASCIVIITMVFSSQIIFVFASGFDANTSAIASKFLRISIFSIYFIGMCGVFSAYLKIKGDYFSPSIIGIVLSIVEIVSCIVAYHFNDVILAVGITVAALAQFLVVFLSAWHHGYRHSFKNGLKDPYIKKAILMSLPVMIGLGVDEINVIVDRTIASGFEAGSISALNYSNTLVGIVHNVISVSINTVLFTEVSRLATIDDRKQIATHIHESLQLALLFLIPSTVGIIIYSEPIIHVLYERGNFTHESTLLTAGAMIFYSLYIIPNGVRLLSQSYFYAYGKTKFCMYVGFIAVAVNILFNILFSRFMGIDGLALATSLGVAVGAVILFMRLVHDNKEINPFKLLRTSLIMLMNALIMGAISYVGYKFLAARFPILIALIVAVLIAVILYFILSLLTKTMNKNVLGKFLRHKG